MANSSHYLRQLERAQRLIEEVRAAHTSTDGTYRDVTTALTGALANLDAAALQIDELDQKDEDLD